MSGIGTPALFVLGRHDAMYPVESLREAASTQTRAATRSAAINSSSAAWSTRNQALAC